MNTPVVILFLTVTLTIYADPLIIDTLQGKVQGFYVNEKIRAFLGVPFAYPPIGDLRFRPTKQFPDEIQWSDVRDARKFAPICLQNGRIILPANEDCLYLNIHTPTNASNLPVLVFIHGGSFETGSSSLYNGSYFASSIYAPVVYVAIQYRLGALGFIGDKELLAESGTTGNYGIDDQIVALNWIKKNIKNFGGNPDHITISGESAGGISVLIHMVSPMSKKNFVHAIVQSGVFYPEAIMSLEGAFNTSEKLKNILNCANIKCLRSLSASDIVKAQNGMQWRPVIDNKYLEKSIVMYMKRNEIFGVPVIIGNTANEWAYWTCAQYSNITDEQLKELLLLTYGPMITSKIYQVYNRADFPDSISMLNTILSNQHMHCPARYISRFVTKAGKNAYLYTFSHYLPNLEKCRKAEHSAELAFEFPELGHILDPSHTFTDQEWELNSDIVRYWTNFATTGDPNQKGQGNQVFWKSNTEIADYDLKIALSQDMTLRENYYQTVCELWDSQMTSM